MYHKKVFVLIALALVMLLAACAPKNPTLTLELGKCTYSGPNPIPYGKFTLDVVIPKKNDPGSGFALSFINASSGKTFADVKALESQPVTNPPTFLTTITVDGPMAFDKSLSVNLEDWKGYVKYQPLILTCLQNNASGETRDIEDLEIPVH
jgi:hypothetical protein